MNKGIQVNVSGGQGVEFGDIVQGRYTRIESVNSTANSLSEEVFLQIFKELNDRVLKNPDQTIEIEALKEDLSDLRSAFKENKPFKWGSLAESAKVFYEKYGWAGNLIEKLFTGAGIV
jgi:hypothetical protein